MYLGSNHNPALDCLDFKPLYDQWIPLAAPYFFSKQIYDDTLNNEMMACLSNCLDSYIEKSKNSRIDKKLMGWKGPRSMYLLPLFHDYFSDVKFIHLVRDGRDMALSKNQNQLSLYGDLLLGDQASSLCQAEKSILLWSTINTAVSEFGNKHLKSNYLIIHYEDLVSDTIKTLSKISSFSNLNSDALDGVSDVFSPSKGMGRWKGLPQTNINRLVDTGHKGLYFYNYL